MSRQVYLATKRLFDVIVASAGILVTSPLMLLIAVAVKFDSPGPAFYLGKRTGLEGKPFRIYKFRSMVADAEQLGSTATAHRDPRVTRVGSFLRRYKLDELPQLFNVLTGDMSVIGPRPEVEEHTSCYSGEEQRILTVQPGITDYSSLRFFHLGEMLGTDNANQVFIEKFRDEKNRLRLEYVKRQSFSTDMHILWLTVVRLLAR